MAEFKTREFPEGFDVVVNVDDLDSVEEIDRKFEMLSAEGAREMAKNYGAPEAERDEEK